MEAGVPRRAVVRALVGGYERLREEEVSHDSELPFICLTDDASLRSTTWDLVLVEPRMPHDVTRSARALKILGHPALADYDETLWVDNTVALTVPPDALFDEWLGHADVAAPLHSYRSSILGEAEAVLDSGLDDFARVYEQLTHYLATAPTVLEENPHWTGMLARRWTDTSVGAMQAWWEDVLRYSRRDQLSFVPVMRRLGVQLGSVELDSHSSQWHTWPRAEGRDPSRRGSGLREALRPPAGRIGVLEQTLDEMETTLGVAIASRDQTIADLEAALAEVRELSHATQADLDTVRHQRNLTAQELIDARGRIRRLRRAASRTPAWRRTWGRLVSRLRRRG